MQKKKMEAYYVARSGADALAQYVIMNPSSAEQLITTTDIDANKLAAGNIEGVGSFKIDVTDQSNNRSILKIASEGMVNSTKQSANVYLYLMNASTIFDKAIYTVNDLDISNMKVNGDVSSKGKIKYTSGDSNNSFHGKAYPFSDRNLPEPKFPSPPLASNIPIEVKGGDKTIDNSSTYNEIKVTQDGILNINANDKLVQVVIDKLVVDNSININASGKGRVEIFVNDLMSVTTKGFINNSANSGNLIIYLKEGSVLDIQAGKIINGYIYGPKATVFIQSEKSCINGAVVSNVVLKNTNNGPNGIINYVPIPEEIDVTSIIQAYEIVHWD
jgi:hypothetical protein